MKEGDILVASQLAGDFVLPKNQKEKIVLVAGGIGITPFRSMIKYLIDTKQKRDIVLIYSNRESEDIVYKEVFDEAQNILGIKTVYAITDQKNPAYTGRVDEHMIRSQIPDFKERHFYISGPRTMTLAFEHTLKNVGVKNSHIKIDFFPGFA
jgi:ferredoxin-NADP reductase